MKILFLDKVVKFDKTAVAVGSFDGVHKGHTALIKKTVEKAKERGLTPAVWTFEDYAPKGGAKYIIPPYERYAIFAKLGVKLVFTVRFDDVRDMSADRFVKDVLINDCRADYAVRLQLPLRQGRRRQSRYALPSYEAKRRRRVYLRCRDL